MAGGRGKRLLLSEEKPMLQIGGRPVIEHVLSALKEARQVESIAVAVSQHTPNTAKYLQRLGIKIVETPGKEYVYDVGYAIRKLGLRTVLTLPSDLPLLTGEVIDEVIAEYQKCNKPAFCVVVPLETKEKLGLGGDYAFEVDHKLVVPAGINIIDGRKIDDKELDQAYCLIDKEEIAVNINTIEELEIARGLLEKRNSRN